MFLQSSYCRSDAGCRRQAEEKRGPAIAISVALSLQHTLSTHPGAMLGMLPSLAHCPGPRTVYLGMMRVRSAFATRSAASGGTVGQSALAAAD
jgi:hypothetical protein